jgi:hypothetical protein
MIISRLSAGRHRGICRSPIGLDGAFPAIPAVGKHTSNEQKRSKSGYVMCPSLQIADDRWVHPCARAHLPSPTGHAWRRVRAAAVRAFHAFVCWQAKRLERRLKQFELDGASPT